MKYALLIFGLLWALGASGQIYINSFTFEAAPSANLLLDDYPNAAAAYSLRKLRTAYTGNCIVVRRSSNNDTLAIGFSGNYLDTAALKTFCSGTDCFVRRWYDQAGSARDIAQTTDANQPQIIASGATINLNGLSSIQFDGSNDRMLSTAFAWGTSFTFVGTFSTIDNNNYGKLYSIGVDAQQAGYAFATFAGATAVDWQNNDCLVFGKGYNSTSNPRIVSNGAIFTNNVQNLVFVNMSSVASNFFRNNTEISYRVRTTGNTDNASNILYIGSADTNIQNFRGNAQELIFYTSNMSTSRTGIQSNVNGFYSIY